jgi:hypothetical protein
MTSEHRPWRRQDEAFWRAHHEAWKRSDLNQRQYCEAEGIPLEAFGNWRVQFKAEPQPPERKLLYRRRPLSPPLSPPHPHIIQPAGRVHRARTGETRSVTTRACRKLFETIRPLGAVHS